jgi:hypothetical protein
MIQNAQNDTERSELQRVLPVSCLAGFASLAVNVYLTANKAKMRQRAQSKPTANQDDAL